MISFALGGFLIAHTNKGLCLSTHKSVVVLGKCDETNPSQQWMWTSTMRLNHTLMSRCLWVNQSPAVPRHVRLVNLSDCDTAPAWKCYDNRGTFGLAETPMFLRKQGVRVVARLEPKYSNWSMMTVDSEGRRVSMSLCPTTGQPTVSPSHKCSHVSWRFGLIWLLLPFLFSQHSLKNAGLLGYIQIWTNPAAGLKF